MSDKIKMSDVFNGVDTASISMINLVVGSTPERRMGAIMAINAYDANQELIERYQKLVCQTCDGHGAVGNILDSMDCPDCTLYVGPSEEIAKQQEEISELKAMVNALINGAQQINSSAAKNMYGETVIGKTVDYIELINISNKTPKQCLATTNAQAVTDAILNSEQIDIDGHKYVGLEDLEVNINQLLEQSK